MKSTFESNAFISQFKTQTIHFKTIFTAALLCFDQKQNTLAGFERGSSVPEADARPLCIVARCICEKITQ
jgi:hypothetical protein